MRATRWMGVAVLFLLTGLSSGLAGAGDEARVERDGHVAGELLIKFRKGAPPGRILAAARAVGAAHIRSFAALGVRHWRLGRGLTVDKALQILAKRPHVEYAEPNHVVWAHDFTDLGTQVFPDDASFQDLWGMHNLGLTGGTTDADIDAPEAWDVRRHASNIVVGIVDTGIDYTHEDLAGNMWVNTADPIGDPDGDLNHDDDGNGIVDDYYGANFIGSGIATGDPMDDAGHGSHTAGTVGAVGGNGKGVVGVCWSVKLMALKWLDAGGRGNIADAVEAIQYASSMGTTAHILSNSWGTGRRSKTLDAAIKAFPGLFVASAGNDGTSRKQYPGGFPLANIVTVAATDSDDLLASWSNHGDWVHLAAPGVDIYSCNYNNNRYRTMSGTSMACPHVAGAAALLMGNGVTSTAAVKTALLDGVDPIPALSGVVTSGGRLNLYRALTGESPSPGSPDITPPADITTLESTAPPTSDAVDLAWEATGDDGMVGPAFVYDVRYTTVDPATDSTWWDNASRATGEPQPSDPGLGTEEEPVVETFTLVGLEPTTTYWIAVQALDEAGNTSAVSNIVKAATAVGAWTTQAVDTVGGYYKGLDFHGGSGAFTIGCAHSVGDSVVVLLFDGFEWIREVVDGNTNDGAGIDFAFAPDGTPTVSYGWGKIRFAYRKGAGQWTVESIEKGRANNDYTALVYDPGGNPTVAYRKGNDLRFARKSGVTSGTWTAETVERAGARYQAMAYTADGDPVIAYSDDPDGDGWLSALKIATKVDGAWVIQTLHQGTRGQGVHASIAVDSGGRLMVADAVDYTIHLFVGTHDGAAWTLTPAGTIDIGSGIRLAFDGTTPVVSYSWGGDTWAAQGAEASGSWIWTTEYVAGRSTGRTGIGVDPSGGLGILYGMQGGGLGLAQPSTEGGGD